MWCGPFVGFWWVFPLVGLLFCVGFFVVAFRFAGRGRGFGCMRGHHRENEHHAG